MTSTNSRIDLLKEAMSIELERAELQSKLDGIVSRLNEIRDALFSESPATGGAPSAIAGKGRSQNGTLKQRILAALAAAGSEGMRVKDLAVAVASKPATLHSWFQFARKSVPSVRKVGPGRYRMVGPVPHASAAPAAVVQSKKAPFSKLNKRGELSDSILGALKAAGSTGLTVGEMARRFDVKPRNLFVWFSTTA